MTLENYIIESISTGKHRKDYSPSTPEDIDNTITIGELVGLLERMGYTELDDKSVVTVFDRLDYPVYRTRTVNNNVRVLVKNNPDDYFRVIFDRRDRTLKRVEYMSDLIRGGRTVDSSIDELIDYLK